MPQIALTLREGELYLKNQSTERTPELRNEQVVVLKNVSVKSLTLFPVSKAG